MGLEAPFGVPVQLGDGRMVLRRLALAEVEIEGVRRPVLVAPGEEGETPSSVTQCWIIWDSRSTPCAVEHALEKTPAIAYMEGRPALPS